jgi:hypothetical protein
VRSSVRPTSASRNADGGKCSACHEPDRPEGHISAPRTEGPDFVRQTFRPLSEAIRSNEERRLARKQGPTGYELVYVVHDRRPYQENQEQQRHPDPETSRLPETHVLNRFLSGGRFRRMKHLCWRFRLEFFAIPARIKMIVDRFSTTWALPH